MSHKLIGDVKWVMMTGYPEVSGTDGVEQLTVKYTANAEGIEDRLPEYGSFYENSAAPFFDRYTGLKLSTRSIKPMDSGNVFEITLGYILPENLLPNFTSTVSEEWEYDTQDYDVPLAQHKNYKYFWNHKLIGKLLKDKSPITPSWYNEKTTGEITGPDAMKYKWIKPNDKVPDGWCVLTNEGKPGVESFRSGITTVQMIKRSGNKRNLEKSAASDYTMETPKETFGKTGSWLRGGSKIRKSGKRWELTVSYLNSKYYDKDLY